MNDVCECVPGHRVFADVVKLRMSHIGLGWALNPRIDVLIRERRRKFTYRNRDTQIPRGEGLVMTEVEIGIMLPQTKEYQGLPATSRR